MAKIKGAWEWNGQLDIQSFPGDNNEIFDMAFTIDNIPCYGISLSGRENDALAFHFIGGSIDFYIDGLGLPDDYKVFTISGEQDIDDDLYNWIVNNTKRILQQETYITYNGETVDFIVVGESITLHTKGKVMEDDIRIAVVMPEEEPGLYDANGNNVATWSSLTNSYGMDVERDYIGDALNDKALPANVLASNSELSAGTKLVIPSTVWQIGQNAFAGANNLTDVVISYGVSRINLYAFASCKKLKNVTVPGSVAEIGIGAFDGCTSMTNATLREGIKSIGAYAFSGCPLTSLKLPDGLKTIGSLAFKGCKATSVTIPRSITVLGEGVFGSCQNMQDIFVEDGNEQYKSESFIGDDGKQHRYLVDLPANSIIQFPGGYKGHFEIPTGFVTIWGYSFFETLVLDVTIPNTVTDIGGYAFAGSYNFNLLELPQNIVSIGAWAFRNCANLCGKYDDELMQYKLNILSDKLQTISQGLFFGCSGLVNLYFEDGILQIAADAFLNCLNLLKISIPDTVKEIGDSIIDATAENTQVVYRGTSASWRDVAIGKENDSWIERVAFS